MGRPWTGGDHPSPRNPFLYRWVKTASGHPLESIPSCRSMVRLVMTGGVVSVEQAAGLIVAEWQTRGEYGSGASNGLIVQGWGFHPVSGNLRLNAGDKPAGVPWATPRNASLFTAAGVAAVAPKSVELFERLESARRSLGLRRFRHLCMDYEESQQPALGGQDYGADAAAGVPFGYYTPCLNDPRASSEAIYEGVTAQGVDALRSGEGFAFDDAQTGLSPANRTFNTRFIGSLPVRSWALQRGVYAAARAASPGILCSNYDDLNASNRAANLYRDGFQPALFDYPHRWHYGDAAAPVLNPFNWNNAAPLVLPGESHEDFYVRMMLERVRACRDGSQGGGRIVPWIAEPGLYDDNGGYTTTVAAYLRIMQDCWREGVFEWFMFGNTDTDPRVDAVYDLWTQFRAWVDAQP